jgi:hypothetical protein
VNKDDEGKVVDEVNVGAVVELFNENNDEEGV